MDEKSLQIPEQIPMLPVRDMVIFPYMIIPLYVGREFSIKAVEESLSKNRLIFLASQKDLGEENPACLLYTSPSPRDRQKSRMPSSA